MIKYYRGNGRFWIRFFGIGFAIRDIAKHGLSFSERGGYEKYIRLGKWVVTLLKFLSFERILCQE